MTCIVNFKTKKELKEAVNKRKIFYIEDPSFFNPRTFTTKDMKHGEVICVTNHPKRSWFAQLKKVGGDISVR